MCRSSCTRCKACCIDHTISLTHFVCQAVLPSGAQTADQELIRRLVVNLRDYMRSLLDLKSAAVDHGCWEEDHSHSAPTADDNTEDGNGWATDEATDSESEDEAEPPPPPPPPPRQPPPQPARPKNAYRPNPIRSPTEKLLATEAIDHIRAIASMRFEAHCDRLAAMLGLQEDATFKQLKYGYRRTARLIHPDKCSVNGAEEAVKVLNNAFELVENEANDL